MTGWPSAFWWSTYVAELFRQRFRREVRQGAYVMHFANSGAGLTHEAVETRLTDAWMSKVIEPLITVTQGGRIIDQEKYRGMIRRTDEDVAADRTRRGSAFVRVELAARSPPAKVRKRRIAPIRLGYPNRRTAIRR